MESQTSDVVESPSSAAATAKTPPLLAGDPKSMPSLQLPKIIPFDTLARCGEEIWIENKGEIYRLRRTKQGKLILTK